MVSLVDFRKIENKDQLLKWTEVVRNYAGGSTAQWTDLQDVYGRSSYQLIEDIAIELKGSERSYVFFAIWKCSGEWAFSTVVDAWIKYRMKRAEGDYFQKEIQPLLDNIEERENALEESKKKIYRKIGDLRTENVRLQSRVDYLTEELRDATRRSVDRRAQLVKLRNVAEAIKTIQEFAGNGSSEF